MPETLELTSPTFTPPKLKGRVILRVGYRCIMAIACAVLAEQLPEGSFGREQLMRQMRKHADIMAKIGLPTEKKQVVRRRRTS